MLAALMAEVVGGGAMALLFVGSPPATDVPSTTDAAVAAAADAPTSAARSPGARALELPRSSDDAHFSSRSTGATSEANRPAVLHDADEVPGIAKGRDAVYTTRSRGASLAGVSPTNPAAALLVLVRDPRSGVLMSLALSSEPGAGSLVHRGEDEVWVAVGPSLPLPPAPPLPPPALEANQALEYPRGDARARTSARVMPWLALGGAGPIFLGGLIDADAEAAARAETCEGRCESIVKKGVVVLARGLPDGYADMVAASLAARAGDAHAALLTLARDAGRWWPSRVPVRSAWLDRADPQGLPEETLVVTEDRRGRANARIAGLHRAHLGSVRVPALLETASNTTNATRRAQLLQEAIVLSRQLVRENPSVAMWQANLALGYAMASKADDRVATPIEAALRVGSKDVAVLMKIAEVYLVRGDRSAARRVAKRAMKAAPGNDEVRSLLQALKPS
jgi:hypothetical protein